MKFLSKQWTQTIFLGCLLLCALSFSACLTGAKKTQKDYRTAETVKNGQKSQPGTRVRTNTGTSTVIKPPTKPSTEGYPNTNQPSNPNNTSTNPNDTNGNNSGHVSDTQDPEPVINPYHIAVMLPFNTSQYEAIGHFDSLPKSSNLALELYEGILMGAETLKQMEIPLDIKVYDTQKDVGELRKILSQPEMEMTDLIIGPVYNSTLKEAANFAQKNGVYMVAPLSPSTKNTRQNPYYCIANPTVETHCVQLYDYVSTTKSDAQVIAISGTKSSEVRLADLVYNYSIQKAGQNTEGYNNNVFHRITYQQNSIEELESYLSPDRENVVMVTAFKEIMINDLLTKLNFLRTKYNITVFGMPNWLNMKTLELEYLANLNFHISQTIWADEKNPDYQAFNNAFMKNFSAKPSKNVLAGYDLMLYFGQMLQVHGEENLGTYLNETPNTHGILGSNYLFEGASPDQYSSQFMGTDYLENKYVHILRYNPQTFTFEKVK